MRSAVFRFIFVALITAVWGLVFLPTVNAQASVLIDATKPFVDRGELAGAVMMVANKDKILALEAVGKYDARYEQSYDPHALFGLASQGKTYTAIALMMLVDNGKLDLDDPVDRYLPEFRDVKTWKLVNTDGLEQYRLAKPAKRLLVRHLLNHTSGVQYPTYQAEQIPRRDLYPSVKLSQITLATRVQGYSVLPLEAEPGSRFKYSSVGPNIAGRLIEIVSKISYNVFLRQRLLEPLGMKTAAEYLATRTTTSPAGGIRINAQENGLFGQMVLNGGVWKGKRYLSEKNLKRMLQSEPGIDQQYRLGWIVQDESGYVFGTGGSGTRLTIDNKHGLVFVFMTRARPGDKAVEAANAFEAAAIASYGRSDSQ